MDTANLEKKVTELEEKIARLERMFEELRNPSTVPPEVLSALKSLGL